MDANLWIGMLRIVDSRCEAPELREFCDSPLPPKVFRGGQVATKPETPHSQTPAWEPVLAKFRFAVGK